jgi:type IV pilus assembly protein PilZ
MSEVSKAVLTLSLRDQASLYRAYMSFLRNGGLFVPTQKSYRLGEEVLIELHLMDEPERRLIEGKVVWLTPAGAQGNRATGIGVEFSLEAASDNEDIENYLAGMLDSERATHTL